MPDTALRVIQNTAFQIAGIPVSESAEESAKSITIKQQIGETYADNLIYWIEHEFYIPELNGPLVMEPYQRAVLREAVRQDNQGRFVYDLVLWSDIKKSIKSTIAAAVALHRALSRDWCSVKIVANDLKQASSRVYESIVRCITLNPHLKPHARISGNTIYLSNSSKIEAVPIDPKGEAGGNDDFIEFTELHAAESKASKAMWSEMTIPPTKHGFAQRWIDTYAGHTGEAPILEPLYKKCVQPDNLLILNDPDAPPGLELYRHSAQLCLWNCSPRMPWQSPEYYASEADTLTETEFNRMHRNQWGASESVFVPFAWWMNCKVPTLPPLDKYKELAVGIDAAVSGDCFGIVGVSRHSDKVAVRYVRKWIPPKHGKIVYTNVNDPLDIAYPEGVLRWLAKTYNVIVFKYDPYQLHDLCSRLGDESVGFFEPLTQGAPRLISDKQLYDFIRDQRVLHEDDPDLTEHIKNANQKNSGENDNQLRIVKRADDLKIDLAVSLAMAVVGAMEYLAE